MKSKIEFLVAAMNETQATIRALDVKLAALLVAVLTPISLLSTISAPFVLIYSKLGSCIAGLLVVIFLCAWGGAVMCYALALGAISHPAKHVKNSGEASGKFFSPGYFVFSLADALTNFGSATSRVSVGEHIDGMPKNEEEIEKELAFEHLKLIFIRDLKLHRLACGFRFTGLAVIISLALYAINGIASL